MGAAYSMYGHTYSAYSVYGHTYNKRMDKPGKVANPSRGQPNRKK